MKKFDTYLDLCTQVYDLSKPIPPKDSYEFYRSYVASAKGPILAPMCGSGRFLLPLLEEGFDIQGFDASEHMLEALHSKAKSKNLKPDVWQDFVKDLKKQEKYGLVFIPAGSFGLIIDIEESIEALKIFYEHLNTEGTLVFEVETLKSAPNQLGVWRTSVWPKKDGKIIVANFLDFSLENNVSRTICKYELVDGNDIIQTEVEIFNIRLYDSSQIIEMLTKAGFRDVKVFKPFDKFSKSDKNDELIVCECRK
ncbi:MAG TPA: methyltransferase domain-containing protein [Gammaproteobacteria bacterium]|nr:methyltransferase domain-containing protein [Gammaproteobacteria bacterium]